MTFSFSPSDNDPYQSESGSIELSNVEYQPITGISGEAAYKLMFEGNFVQSNDDDQSHISGTVVVNIPAGIF